MLMTDAPSTDEIELSVVVPVKNEAENIRILIDEIDAALEPCGVRYEILYVDDGSDDATLGELVAVGTSNERLRVIRHRTSAGQSTAVLTGVRHARGIWIATLDGDGQNDPADIPKLLEKRGDPLLLLAGWRAHRKDTAYYRFQSRIANRVRSALLGDATPDTGCGTETFQCRDLPPSAAFRSFPPFSSCPVHPGRRQRGIGCRQSPPPAARRIEIRPDEPALGRDRRYFRCDVAEKPTGTTGHSARTD